MGFGCSRSFLFVAFRRYLCLLSGRSYVLVVLVGLMVWRLSRLLSDTRRGAYQLVTPGFMLVSLRYSRYSHRTPREGLNPSSH